MIGQGLLVAAPRNRIVRRIDNNRRVALSGQVNHRTELDIDEGPVDPALEIRHVTLVLPPSAAQQRELDQLLERQQDPASPDYHRWLTPEEFGARFGASDDDLRQIRQWLESQHLRVKETARARNAIAFDAAAADLETAFRMEMRYYRGESRRHYANRTEPSVPEALAPVVGAIRGLNDFRIKPPRRAIRSSSLQPRYNPSPGENRVGPDDFSTIYNIAPLYADGLNGAGQKIAIIGQTEIRLSDVAYFRSFFGLAPNEPETLLVPGLQNPGMVPDDLLEAHLDVEWAGAVARNATIVYVYAPGVDDSLQYAIDHNVAPVVSMSYGLCETVAGSWGTIWRALAQQANAQGITWFGPSGDAGGADCYAGPGTRSGLAVDLPSAIPEVTAVGGTEFDEGAGTYWSTYNSVPGRASALSYIPEKAWNDSTVNDLSATGGGASTLFARPAWQTGTGVPAGTMRLVPDVSFAASWDHDGYSVYSDRYMETVGGTSASSPTWAGVAALLNQAMVSRGLQATPGLGNLNPKLYALAKSSPSVFHDVTNGDNIAIISCYSGQRNCTSGSCGFSAGPGYDMTTGWGSVDVTAFVNSLAVSTVVKSAVTMSVAANPQVVPVGASILVTATVKSSNGGLPTGIVTFSAEGSTLGTAQLSGSGNTATASLTIGYAQLPASATAVDASYGGDAAYNGAAGSASFSFAPALSGIQSPAAGARLSGSSVTFTWSATLGAARYKLLIGSSLGASDLFLQETIGTSLTVASLPTDGRVLYVELSTFLNGSYQAPNRYTYLAYLQSAALRFQSMTPCRVVDTRLAIGPLGGPFLPPNTSRSFPIQSSACGIPANARAYSLNVTVVPRAYLPFLTLWPTGQAQPLASTLNSDGRIKANAALVAAGDGGAVSVYVAGATDVVIDITGVFVPAASGAGLAFYPLTPCRITDTRSGPAIPAGGSRTVDILASACGVPSTAQAYSLNFTAVPQRGLGYLTTWPAGQTQPYVSTLASPSGTVVANAAILAGGTLGAISVYSTDPTHLVIDINGYFAPAGGAGALSFYATAPCRISDTRSAVGTYGGPVLASAQSRMIPVLQSSCGTPAAARAFALNATVVPVGGLGYLTLWPSDVARPLVSTLNSIDGSITANAAIVPASPLGQVSAYAEGFTHLVLDLNGYFAP